MLDELFTSLRELEELEAIHEEDDSGSGTDLWDELLLDPVDELVELSLELRMTFCDELLLDPIASLQDDDVGASSDDDFGLFTDDDDAIELDRFSDHASNALEESSPQATTKNNEERGNKNRFINTSLTFSPFVNILLPPPKINTFMQQNLKYLTKITIFAKYFDKKNSICYTRSIYGD